MNSPRKFSLKNLLTDKNFLTIVFSILVGIFLILAIVFTLKHFKTEIKETPVIGALSLDGETLTVKAGDDKDLVYCLNEEVKSSTCEWQTYNTFHLSEEKTFYVFVKSESSGKVSKPEKFTYQQLDFENMRM